MATNIQKFQKYFPGLFQRDFETNSLKVSINKKYSTMNLSWPPFIHVIDRETLETLISCPSFMHIHLQIRYGEVGELESFWYAEFMIPSKVKSK